MIAGWCIDVDRPLTADEELRAMVNHETLVAVVNLIAIEGFMALAKDPLPCPIRTPGRPGARD
jgi:hypothetical protein